MKIDILTQLETKLYDFDISGFSKDFQELITAIETILVSSDNVTQQKMAKWIQEMYIAYQHKDYLYALEVAKTNLTVVGSVQ